VTIESDADALSATSDNDTLALDTFTSEPAPQRADDTTLAFSEDAISTADTLRFEVEPASVASVEPASDDVSDALNVDDDLALTPKALDLPSLNLDDVPQSAEAASSKPLSATTGEQTLSSEDAVFDSLPELSLELGGPNDAIGERVSDDALEIEEISLGSADAALNETPAVEVAADSIAFPAISLDVADSGTASAEEIADEPEEVNTKLDLIQAYIDMEDVVGAKELIDEVIAEGGERQRQRASELLAKLA